jgi:hypothetical protein
VPAKASSGGVGECPAFTCNSTLPRSVVFAGMYFSFTLPVFWSAPCPPPVRLRERERERPAELERSEGVGLAARE